MEEKNLFKLSGWTSLKLSGEDVGHFLNGQFTSNIDSLLEKQAQFSTRVSRTGHLKAYCYIIHLNKNTFLLLCPSFLAEILREDLEKFIIMEDVVFGDNEEAFSISFDEKLAANGELNFFFLNRPATLFLERSTEIYPKEEIDRMSLIFGLPSDQLIIDGKALVNETGLVDLGVSLTKGCFVGQETVKKIESNRGAGKKEILLFVANGHEVKEEVLTIDEVEYSILGKINSDRGQYLKINAKREHRVSEKTYSAKFNEKFLDVIARPFSLKHEKEYSSDLFEKGIKLFTENKDQEAKSLFELALRFVPNDEEVLESLGALEGRLGNYNRAIELMNELERQNPNSVMASTNKSLFYMKIGEIEKAEEEKAKATVKGFEAAAKDSKAAAKDNLEEIERKISMFEQVLEIDPEDHMANEGLSRSYFNLGKYEESLKYCEKLISLNENDFKARATKVKIKMKNGETEYALGSLPEIIDLAGKKGDFVLANEMQSLLSSLKNS